jgi:hypothetical protein
VRIQAARIEAALLWFMYLSTLSEVWTCSFDDIEDCDSMWAYLNGARPREAPIGLGKYIKDLGPMTYDRTFDGVLAVSCWREVDPAMPAMNQNLYQLAVEQTDKAALRGLALILRDRIGQLGCSTGEQQLANLAFVNVLGGFMDRALIRASDPTRSDALAAQLSAATPAEVDIAKAQGLIDELFRCP